MAGSDDEGEAEVGRDAGDDDELLARIKDWHSCGIRHWRPWRTEAEAMFDIVAGHQWDEADLDALKDALRPAVTFNRTGPFIDGVSGLEISNRQEARYIPRQLGSAGKNELLTGAEKWARDETDAEDEESEAFRDALICGVGCTQTLMAYDEDADGMIGIDQVDPQEVIVDPSANKANYADAGWIIRERDVPLERARELVRAESDKDFDDEQLNATWASDGDTRSTDIIDAIDAQLYRQGEDDAVDEKKDTVRLVEVEWWETVTAYRVADPSTGAIKRLSSREHTILQDRAKKVGMPRIKSVRDKQRKYKRALVGNEVLSVSDGPEQGGFTFKFITGKWDRRKRCFYGLVRPMKDPQQWANKFFSQMLHIINSNSKGGLLAEEDAFENWDDAQDTWAQTGGITKLAPGGLAKVQQKEPATFPAAIHQLMEYTIGAIPGVTGFSPEMMGLVDRNQPGVLEMQRKQQGMTLLAGFFNSLRRYRKQQGRLMLWYIQTFISDGRLVRIGGPENAQYVQLIRDHTIGEYDVIVDDTPSSPNMKERVWSALVQMAPIMAKMQIPPEALLDFLEYSPLPVNLVQKLKENAQKAAQQNQGGPSQTEQAQMQKDAAAARNFDVRSQSEQARVQIEMEKTKAQIENQKALAIAALAKIGMDQDANALARANAAMEALTGAHQAAMQQEQHQAALGQGQADQAAASQQQQAAQQQAAHDQQLAWAQHELAQKQADDAAKAAQQQGTQK